jgi:hypothetical protein
MFTKAGEGVVRYWRLFLAFTRLDDSAVCEMSAGRGLEDDFHDFPDSTLPYPDHFMVHTCMRCGKLFCI